MGKVIEENGVLWYEERDYSLGKCHIGRKYIGLAEKPKEDKKTKKTKKVEDE